MLMGLSSPVPSSEHPCGWPLHPRVSHSKMIVEMIKQKIIKIEKAGITVHLYFCRKLITYIMTEEIEKGGIRLD
jgi:hypothetical protein